MFQLVTQIAEAAAEIRRSWNVRPAAGIILGTGLGNLAKEIQAEAVLAYEEIPHFVRSTATGHKGQLVCGRIGETAVVTMEGRFHRYEGYSLEQITLPVRVMQALGIELLVISNASGGLQPYYLPGDILVIEDHVNLMGANPLVGVNDSRLGPRFPDMSRPYDRALVERSLAIARRENFVAHRGVYAAVSGPNYETRAEYRFLRRIGADVIGMSTVPEVIVAAQVGLRVLALSVITNVCLPDAVAKTDGESVVAAARAAEHKMRRLVLAILAEEERANCRQDSGCNGTSSRAEFRLSEESTAS
ncbi:MAG TPA: purine-nucleoside phosphorylase [Pirellulales bacterium]|nr:purine-nucleoside phosphorylase [Pirellulales bacterium]